MSGTSLDTRSYRLISIDVLRGLAIVLMALDHVRDFFLIGSTNDPMAETEISASVFATRWVTHFCAPVFVLLAGVSAGLMANRRTSKELFQFLLARGIWLIIVDWILISTALTFSPFGLDELNGKVAVVFQVLWAIGASMAALSMFQFIGRRYCLIIGLVIICCHNALDPIWPPSALEDLDRDWPIWVSLHSEMPYKLGPFIIFFQYPVIPWIGVMLTGFGLSQIFEWEGQVRNQFLFRSGVALTTLFFGLRLANIYGDPEPWAIDNEDLTSTIQNFFDTEKYPPSLLFLTMTLGPAAILCSFVDQVPSWIVKPFSTLGRVPFAFYVTHFYLVHLAAMLLGMIQELPVESFATHPNFFPEEYGLSLPGVYVVWLLVLVLMYPLCHWMAMLKARRKDWWLSYV